METTKIQLNFNCRVNAQNQVLERSTLANIRCDSVDEAARLYQQLIEKLGSEVVISDHNELPQIASESPSFVPFKTEADEKPGRCELCNAGLVLRTAGKGPRAGEQFWSCIAFGSKGCLFTKPV